MVQRQTLISFIQPPVSLSSSNMPNYVDGTYDLLVTLADHDHWDEAAIAALAKQIAHQVNDTNLTTQFDTWRAASVQTGSPLFSQLFAASTLSAADKLGHVLTTLGAHLSQTTGDLILDRDFAEQLAPNDAFWDQLAQTVRTAFPNGLALDDSNTRIVHQLRYYIDAHNVAYIRQNFQQTGQTDLEALINFDRDARRHGQASSQASSSRLHNKVPEMLARGVLPALPTANFKRLVNFHSEFIITPVPIPTFLVIPLAQLATVTDVPNYVRNLTIEERNAIINGASFNYADRNDYGQTDSIHELFDVHYGDNDPMVRRLAMKPYTAPRSEPAAITLLQQQYDAAVEQSNN
ncbi:DUF3114 domain-containing protein [Furfurilactobacillus curtus]|uniref:DUF3114 domain-containing protein n=1 Tax=Furfurilactobacillus curtus TaxID=1746200 RepID=A0ABQ5JKQ2_9LACO